MTDEPRDEKVKHDKIPVITDLAEAKRVGYVQPGQAGGCFKDPGYDPNHESCKVCFWYDKCAEATYMHADELLVSAAQAMDGVDKKKPRIKLPPSFIELDRKIREELSQVVRLTKETTIVYCFRTKKLVSIVQPIELDAITLVFHNCVKDDLDDSSLPCKLWCGDNRAPDKPFLFVQEDQLEAGFQLIEQLYRKLESEFNRVSEDKYRDVKRQSKAELVQKAAGIESIRRRKGRSKGKARCGAGRDREVSLESDVQETGRGEGSASRSSEGPE